MINERGLNLICALSICNYVVYTNYITNFIASVVFSLFGMNFPFFVDVCVCFIFIIFFLLFWSCRSFF